MEHVKISIDNPEEFDRILAEGLPCGNDLHVITKRGATVAGKAVVMLTFAVKTPDGEMHRAQIVTTAANMLMISSALGGAHGNNEDAFIPL